MEKGYNTLLSMDKMKHVELIVAKLTPRPPKIITSLAPIATPTTVDSDSNSESKTDTDCTDLLSDETCERGKECEKKCEYLIFLKDLAARLNV